MSAIDLQERLKRWRLLLGGDQADGINISLSGRDAAMDQAMAALYEGRGYGGVGGSGGKGGARGAGLGASAPTAARWLGDIREYFPSSVVRVMQKDAIDRLGMRSQIGRA